MDTSVLPGYPLAVSCPQSHPSLLLEGVLSTQRHGRWLSALFVG